MSKVSKKRQSFNYSALSADSEVEIAPLWVHKDCMRVVWGSTVGKFNQSGLK